MRLLHVNSLQFKEFYGSNVPKYMIASHRWCDDEPTFSTFADHQHRGSQGYRKVLGFCNIVRRNERGIDWLWIDTCCIDKTNSVELSEAINSMFKWYQNAEVCYAYLSDVGSESKDHKFGQSGWFSRGWTLQELIAPPIVVFFQSDWKLIGYKSANKSESAEHTHLRYLNTAISCITGIPEEALCDFKKCHDLSIEHKMRWMANRETTRPEDMAYSLLGIFGVYMPPIYGEGYEHAYRRLMKEVRDSNGLSEPARNAEPPLDPASPKQQAITSLGDTFREGLGFPKREERQVKLHGTSHYLPLSIFKLREKPSGALYTVIARNGFYEQVFYDGKVEHRVAIGQDDWREPKMEIMFEDCGRWKVHDAVSEKKVQRKDNDGLAAWFAGSSPRAKKSR